ncbi:endopeptidase [Azospirillum sp. TSH58]|uniref:trypsin-like serine peptidase n=1 Tax=Azospirillum sp. TSH58 TaxID=664962 RepID=UPI000D5FE23C|nr:serine protease [Azospirillum sp. TSH58]AWJ85173.1 endopeptidase [Azospirillum sp. TSH58]
MSRLVVAGLIIGMACAVCHPAFAQGNDIGRTTERTLRDATDTLRNIRGRIEDTTRAPKPDGASVHEQRAVEDALNDFLREGARAATSIYGLESKAIYGGDDRKNYGHSRTTPNQRRAADATAALVNAANVLARADGQFYDLPGGNVLDGPSGRGLCTPKQAESLKEPEEPFWDEPNPAFCSGFKVGRNLIATAGHCIRDQESCNNTRFVFGFYKTNDKPQPEQGIAAKNVYKCEKIVGGELEPGIGSDWRIVQVDREIDAPQVTIRASSSPPINVGEGVTVIGYPLGLPVKIADGAAVRSLNAKRGFFVANLDTYQGNSGSAVFNTARLSQGELLIEGILVRGENDFKINSPCFISKRCPIDGCRGEDVTLANRLEKALKP